MLFVILICILNDTLNAQDLPPICPNPSYMTSTCAAACLICDIHGFKGRNTSTVPGELPPDFCTTVKHNGQWIAFMASSVRLKLNLAVSNCNRGDGLEVGLYESSDCKTFRKISNCLGDVPQGTTGVLTVSQNLVIGNYYYLVIDGNRGDVCDYQVSIVEGSTKVSPLDTSGTITGPWVLCEGEEADYSVYQVPGAAWQQWTLEGASLGTGSTKKIKWTQPGNFELCVRAFNACDEGAPSCRTIKVLSKSYATLDASICEGDSFEVAKGQFFKSTGVYQVNLTGFNGCDSLLQLSLTAHPSDLSSRSFNLCQGDTLRLNSRYYNAAGIYSDTLQNLSGCDSIISIQIKTIVCNIQGDLALLNPPCHGDSKGQIRLGVNQGTAPLHYQYEHLSIPSLRGQGDLLSLSDSLILKDLPAGDYRIRIADDYGNQREFFVSLNEPEVLTAEAVRSSFGNYSLRCGGDRDGWIRASGTGGTKPYRFLWQDGSSADLRDNLGGGSYSVTVTDRNHCSAVGNFELKAPPPLDFDIAGQDPDCLDDRSGLIRILRSSGGVLPYQFSLDGSVFSDQNEFLKLSAGAYRVILRDSLDCRDTLVWELHQPEHNFISGATEYTLSLGDSVLLELLRQSEPARVQWSPPDGLSCTQCPEPFAKPVKDVDYKLRTWSVDGCPDSLVVSIKVIKDRRIWAPNVFSPNSDQINDRFKLYGGPQFTGIRYLRIYDRWGGQIYETLDADPHAPLTGWDGKKNGQLLLPGVYTWLAEVEFLDGETEFLSGDLTLMR